MIGGVLLDLDDTLVDRTAAVRAWLATLPPPVDTAALAELDGGGYGDRRAFFAALASAMTWSPTAARQRFRDGMLSHLRPMAGAIAVLQRLGRRYRTAIASNGDADMQRRKLAACGLMGSVEEIVISGEIGHSKPSSRFFRYALDRIGCRPDAALMIGDHPVNDIAGAHAAGLRTCWLRRPGWAVPAMADACVDHLDEVEPA